MSFDTPADKFFNLCSEKTAVRVSVLAKLHYDHGFPIEKVSKLTKRRGDDFLEMVVAKKAKEEGVAVVATPTTSETPTATTSIPPSATPQSKAPPRPSTTSTPQSTSPSPQPTQAASSQNNIFNNAIAAMAAAQQAANPNLLAQLQLAAAVAGASKAGGASTSGNKGSKK